MQAIKEEAFNNDGNPGMKDANPFRIVAVSGASEKSFSDHDATYLRNLWSDEASSRQQNAEEKNVNFSQDENFNTEITRKVSQPGRILPRLDVDEKGPQFKLIQTSVGERGVYQTNQPQHQNLNLQQHYAKIARNSLAIRSSKRCLATPGKFRKVTKDIVCLPAEYPEVHSKCRVPRGKEREQLAMLGLVGKMVIQSSWSFETFRTEAVSLFQKHFTCSAEEFTFTFLQCLPGNRKLIKPKISANFKWSGISIINLAAKGSLYIKTNHTLAEPAKNHFLSSTDSFSEADVIEPVTVQKLSDSQTVDVRHPVGVHPIRVDLDSSHCSTSNDVKAPVHHMPNHIQEERESTTGLLLSNQKKNLQSREEYEVAQHAVSTVKPKDHDSARNIVGEDHKKDKTSHPSMTTNCIFKLLRDAGIRTSVCAASHCEIIPVEWVCWRKATSTYLKRHPEAATGQRLSPPKVEMFFKKEENRYLGLSVEQLVVGRITCAGLVVGQSEIDIMNRSIVAMLEILEKACLAKNIVLVNLKVKFGVDANKKEIVLADVISYDSHPQCDLEACGQQNERWMGHGSECKVVVLTESLLYFGHCEKIKVACGIYNIPCEVRVTSAYTGPEETLDIKSHYEGDGIPTVFITVTGRSNSLASILSANTTYPVINCPAVTAEWNAQDVWAVQMTEGLGFSTVLSPEAAAQFAAHILGLSSHLLWSKLRTSSLNKWIAMKQADVKLRQCNV
ncbi:bifunctional phosphoribosylaminoimidazole carboxylase/phosphoribosylaminoimidazole succinocarboxamide synthetase-like [Hyperolius riggenbachi]|uniref:bifunctional phosphoribosylaminoimidazole carboxylase/phosphoribosylaminoimidazole succinocarboxamide synthetase-like n=1 Tax=Hyperolius riggenbachi TaxID=752182 RepID=UPI0035A30C83